MISLLDANIELIKRYIQKINTIKTNITTNRDYMSHHEIELANKQIYVYREIVRDLRDITGY